MASEIKNDKSYKVLARKYRPQTFSELIGQDSLVQTMSNAFRTGRLAQAYMLTGVRGVGKTTTARLIARALNYHPIVNEEDNGKEVEVNKPEFSINMPDKGLHCDAILESRHVDVIEMDAASNTGIDDIREIIESVRYKPVSARYKVYIIDEVHMLSKAAFNGLLKTLEEPPEHVKFIFATTENRKVPVTILSRCQRFDLRRVNIEVLVKHFANIAAKESAKIDKEALLLIARAAEGSVRDGLSLLDQAIAYSSGDINEQQIRDMLGLVDKTKVIDLLESLMQGDIPSALSVMKEQYTSGAETLRIISDVAEFIHLITKLKVINDISYDSSYSELEINKGKEFADKLSIQVLSRTWQALLKGIIEVQSAPDQLAAAEMLIIRIGYLADLPTPETIIKSLVSKKDSSKSLGNQGVISGQKSIDQVRSSVLEGNITSSQINPTMAFSASKPMLKLDDDCLNKSNNTPSFKSLADVAFFAGAKRDIRLKSAVEHYIRLVSFKDSSIEVALEKDAPKGLVNELSRKLEQWTGKRWVVVISSEKGDRTLYEQEQQQIKNDFNMAMQDSKVQDILSRFPNSEVVSVCDIFESIE